MSDFPFRATILIPVYNVEKYLDSCINSLKEQTEPFGNMEILLINDGSRDNSADICRRWADEYENIHFYSKENEGLSKTRNFGLRRAQAPDAAVYGARAALIGGCSSTSNVLAAQMCDTFATGTHAHSWIMAFDS